MDCLTAPFKLLMICFGLWLCLMTASGQGIGPACQRMNISDYANMSFCLPQDVSVTFGASAEGNYSQGRDVNASLLLNGSNVGLLLLYPCEIKADLEPSGLRALAESFDPQLRMAAYSSTPLKISGNKAIWGELKNRTFAAYQPSNRTLAVIFFDEGLPYGTISSFLNSLQITVSESNSPRMYCQQSNVTAQPAKNATTTQPAKNTTAITTTTTKIEPADFPDNISRDILNDTGFGQDTEAMMSRMDISQEALMAEQEATKARLEASEENLKQGIAGL